MSLEPADVLPRLVDQRRLLCKSCRHDEVYPVVAACDWRDHEAVALLNRQCPVVACPVCGAGISLDTPVLVLRPGDPVRWLLSVPGGAVPDAVVTGLVRRVRDAQVDLPLYSPVRVGHDQITAIADRYSGFELARVGHDGTATAATGQDFEVVRARTTVPDVTEAVLELFSAEDEPAVLEVYRRHPALVDPAWAPVCRVVGRRLVGLLEMPEAVRLAQYRLVETGRRRWPHDPVAPDAWEHLDESGRAVLSAADRGADLPDAERRTTFEQLLQMISDQPDRLAFLTEKLAFFFMSLYESPGRRPGDLSVAIPAGLTAMQLLPATFGAAHPLTLLVANDLGAALLDLEEGNSVAAREQAITLLTAAAVSAAGTADPVLADLVHNLGVAYAHRQHGGRAVNQQHAEECFAWALHLARTLTPQRPDSLLRSRLVLASLLAERRPGNRRAATEKALAIYQELLEDPAQRGLLRQADLLIVESNRLSALYQLRQLDPASATIAEVAAVAETLAIAAVQAPRPDPQVLSNAGSVLGSLYHDEGFHNLVLLDRAADLTGLAHTAALAGYSRGHPEVVRIGLNHAAMLGMPVRDETARGGVRYRDGDGSGRLLAGLLDDCPADLLPAHVAVIAANLGRYRFSTGDFAAARDAFRQSMDALDVLYRSVTDPEAQLAELGVPGEPLSWSSVAGWSVSAALRDGAFEAAVTSIEEFRGKLLADRLGTSAPRLGPGVESDGEPVLYVGVSAVGSWLILVPAHGPTTVHESSLTARELRPLVRDLRAAQDTRQRSTALAAIAGLLAPQLTGPARELLVRHGFTEIGVVASGLLSALPLHALPVSDDGACWLEQASVRYLPSATIARRLHSLPPGGRTGVAAVADPELSLARHEADLLRLAYEQVDIPPEHGDRREWLLSVLPEVSWLLLSCHARWLEDDPLRSPIELDREHVVLLADLLVARGGAPDLVIASCCDTGATVESLADEILGFGTGVLMAGARAAVISSWQLGDRVSALILSVFVQETSQGRQPAAALRTAQLWLRDLTVADLFALGDDQPVRGRRLGLPSGLRRELAALRLTRLADDPAVRLYADCAAWGGFSAYGARLPDGGDVVDGVA
ncbi:CHAT domain-containing protein [Micromonospora sp. NPDC047644]|uniref:CHAT domain-containing protein n=1 Tax=Micromonospora sp. NPDC047644 TaxID=3157203 RepID=UPI0034535DD4